MINTPLLEEGLIKLGLGDDNLSLFTQYLTQYIEEIELFNTAYGLVKVKDREELIIKHILDSLAPIKILGSLPDRVKNRSNKSKHTDEQALVNIADLGSGAGLPGIPLAIFMRNSEITLIERMGRRAGFLRNVLAVLALPNVKVLEADLDELAIKPALQFDLIVFRAFRPLEAPIFKGLLKLLAPDGFIAAYKGRRESIEEEMRYLQNQLNVNLSQKILPWEIFPLEVPFLEDERHLLVIDSKTF